MHTVAALFREEQKLLALADADAQLFARRCRLRQQRIRAMANRVVSIYACGGLGSGVVLDQQGHIATNAHVISTSRGLCEKIMVDTAWGARYEAQFIIGEYEQDVAIIRVQPDERFSAVEIAPEVFVGQDVYAIGHPLGNTHTVTRGIVSYLDRRVNSRAYVQTDCAINPGNSGGGLFDDLGRLVGLPTFKEVWADRGRTIPVANLGFAVPGRVVADYYQLALQRNLVRVCRGNPASAHSPFIVV